MTLEHPQHEAIMTELLAYVARAYNANVILYGGQVKDILIFQGWSNVGENWEERGSSTVRYFKGGGSDCVVFVSGFPVLVLLL